MQRAVVLIGFRKTGRHQPLQAVASDIDAAQHRVVSPGIQDINIAIKSIVDQRIPDGWVA